MANAEVDTGRPPSLQNGRSSTVSEDINIDTGDNASFKRSAFNAGLEDSTTDARDKRQKGTALVKEEFLVKLEVGQDLAPKPSGDEADDDAAEAFHHKDRRPTGDSKAKARERNKGQNKGRQFGSSRDEIALCSSRVSTPELSPEDCHYGEKCKFEHDLRKYLDHKRKDLDTFNGICPVFNVKGKCNSGWKCRFVGSHSKEVLREDGRKELILIENADKVASYPTIAGGEDTQPGVVNVLSSEERFNLTKRRTTTPKSDVYIPWLDSKAQHPSTQGQRHKSGSRDDQAGANGARNSSSPEPSSGAARQDERSRFVDPPLLPSEKRRLYFGADTPVLAPLTTQGNLPFRRLCTALGASFTYSEMAMSMPILQGLKSEWALIKAHESEIQPPTFYPTANSKSRQNIVYDYDRSADLTFGAQIAASKPWQAIKATEILTTLLPQGLRVVDLNCGCPIDLVYREGAGSALLDAQNKLEKILRGMNAVSGATPVTVKIRMGTKDKHPTAQKLVDRLVLGSEHSRGDPCGVAAITLHGRSRQQRYTRAADWEYIASTASLIDNLNAKADALVDTIREPDERDQSNPHKGTQARRNKVFFLGNGDVYSHEHFNEHVAHAGVDTCMLARGALIKPWLFEEIATNQYLDKSSSERLTYIEKFCRYGLEAWGSDEIGVGQTRRFLLEWLSFACRYVPVGLLEFLPPNLQDRPPRYRGRDELETLMASDNYKDWIKLSEMFLGPAHKDFRFEPKHKSNSYEAEG